MGLVTAVLGLPLAPVRGVIALGDLIRRRVDEELYNPASVRRELEAAAQARASGEISAEEEAETQQQVVDRLIEPGAPERAESPADEEKR